MAQVFHRGIFNRLVMCIIVTLIGVIIDMWAGTWHLKQPLIESGHLGHFLVFEHV